MAEPPSPYSVSARSKNLIDGYAAPRIRQRTCINRSTHTKGESPAAASGIVSRALLFERPAEPAPLSRLLDVRRPCSR